jgi:DNA/RNA endonuclease G (NUC1)
MGSLVLMFLKSYWKHVVVIAAVASASFMAYSYIYNRGFDAANKDCEERIQKYNDDLKARIKDLENTSIVLSMENEARDKARKKDLEKLLVLIKDKPLTIIKEGNCVPSEAFVETFNSAIDKVNKK